MFTGLVEAFGIINSVENIDNNISLWVKAPFTQELQVDESVSHNGICLTVEEIFEDQFKVTAVKETIDITTIKHWQLGQQLNLERAVRINDRLGGHIVQGHVDTTATCIDIDQQGGSTNFTFQFDEKYAPLVIEKGSVCINGISLTCFGVEKNAFTVTIIPYTYEHTNMHTLQVGHLVNIEFDLIGKYILRMESLKH